MLYRLGYFAAVFVRDRPGVGHVNLSDGAVCLDRDWRRGLDKGDGVAGVFKSNNKPVRLVAVGT